MIDKTFWQKVADNWCKETDGLQTIDDSEQEQNKAMNLDLSDEFDEEIDDILADFDF